MIASRSLYQAFGMYSFLLVRLYACLFVSLGTVSEFNIGDVLLSDVSAAMKSDKRGALGSTSLTQGSGNLESSRLELMLYQCFTDALTLTHGGRRDQDTYHHSDRGLPCLLLRKEEYRMWRLRRRRKLLFRRETPHTRQVRRGTWRVNSNPCRL